MKKMLLLASCLAAAGFARADASISDVVVRPRWPWDEKLDVSYRLDGAEAPLDVKVRAFSGDEDLGEVPDAALAGERFALTGSGVRTFTLDPAKCAFADWGVIGRFRLRLTAAPTAVAAPDEALYRIVDLSGSRAVTDLTRADILNHRHGAYETNPHWISNSVLANLAEPPLFLTGVTNDTAFAAEKLLLRRIPAGVYRVGMSGKAVTRHTVTLTKGYWIGVFEVTRRQWELVTGSSLGGDGRRPADDRAAVTYDALRGCAAENPAYDWPEGREVAPDSVMQRFRTLTGLAFDLPTEAQWLVAASAGAVDCGCYDGSTSRANEASAPMWFLGRGVPNSGVTGRPSGGTAYPGCYLPNAFGLYDVLGNVREMVLDWRGPDVALDAALVDPVGCTRAEAVPGTIAKDASGSFAGQTLIYRVVKGGTCGQSFTGGTVLFSRGEAGIQPNDGYANTGFRLCVTDE